MILKNVKSNEKAGIKAGPRWSMIRNRRPFSMEKEHVYVTYLTSSPSLLGVVWTSGVTKCGACNSWSSRDDRLS